ncbi:FMN reductase [Actinokineospora alba]|uniref:FMN reductase n=1 Tax=Actinokineospora alba TaxID=504798 RepID=A0A1H0G736_9PSEU|nr:NADPH-dependent FMN reductase [Actinokineospora alba]TDP69790.1 SsuE family FMN reductase [Actinokineospora alba]SDI08638.1 FMN reductase [Actinokineospora alba]SDO02707.1 FMN reductase [Actinokineospora alba]
MPSIIVLSGSPSPTSKTAALGGYVEARLRAQGHLVRSFRVRDLPPVALLSADTEHPDIAEVVDAIAGVDAIVVASPVYKAAYSGLLKALLDLLPQFALAGKVVLPLVTGGTPAHVLAIDYALRPVLTSLGADHVVQGWFVLDRHIGVDGATVIEPGAESALRAVVDRFSEVVHDRHPLAAAL